MTKREAAVLQAYTGFKMLEGFDQEYAEQYMNIPVRQHRKSGRRETVCPGLRKPLMRVYSRNVLSKP